MTKSGTSSVFSKSLVLRFAVVMSIAIMSSCKSNESTEVTDDGANKNPVENSEPILAEQTVEVPVDGTLTIALSASDADSDALSYRVLDSGPAHGRLTVDAPNFVYEPDAGYYGPDSFSVIANDGKADSEVAVVSILVRKDLGIPVYVRSTGNDSTGDGTLFSPYATAQKAYDIAFAAAGDRVIDLGVGSFGGVTLSANWPSRIAVRGISTTQSSLGGIIANGRDNFNFTVVDGDDWNREYLSATDKVLIGSNDGYEDWAIPAKDGFSLNIVGEGTANLGNLSANGGNISESGWDYDWGWQGRLGGSIFLTDLSAGNISVDGGSALVGLGGGSVTLLRSIALVISAKGTLSSGGGGDGGAVILTSSRAGSIIVAGGSATSTTLRDSVVWGGGFGGRITLTDAIAENLSLDAGANNPAYTAVGINECRTGGTLVSVRSQHGSVSAAGSPDRDGFYCDGYNSSGYDSGGFDRDGFNAIGYDYEGYGRDGYNDSGYDRNGLDRTGNPAP